MAIAQWYGIGFMILWSLGQIPSWSESFYCFRCLSEKEVSRFSRIILEICHTAFLGGRYPYELQQRKGSYFPFLWCIVVRKQALVLLKTYGPKRYSLLNIWKLALFDQYSPGAFLSNWSSNCWIILIKTIKGNHKHSFETICIDVRAF